MPSVPSMPRKLLRAGTVAAAAAVVAVLGATPAFAHVVAQPTTVAKGGYAVITLRVPDEDDTAGTVALTVTLSPDHPFSSVSTTAVPGWTATTNEITLNPPLKDDDGNTVTKTIGSVTWKAGPGTRIAPGQYLEFPLLLGPFPTDVDQVRLPAVQTYDNGNIVSWDDPPNADGSEPEHPVPTIDLTAATADTAPGIASATPADPPTATAAGSPDTDNTARLLGGAGLLVGALGLGAGGGAVLRSRRPARKDV